MLIIAEHDNVSRKLLTNCFGENYQFKLKNLSEYNSSDGVHFWTVSFEYLSESISELQSEWGETFESDFLHIDFTLNKINELKEQVSSSQKDELYLYIEYFQMKMVKLLFEIEKVKIFG